MRRKQKNKGDILMKKVNKGVNAETQTTDLRKRAEVIAEETADQSAENVEGQSPAEVKQTLHELRVHQVELDMQNEELRSAHMEIDAARKRYFDLYDLAPVGYVTVSEKGLIIEANITAANLLGVGRSALVNQPLTRYILKEDQNIYYLRSKQLLKSATPQAFELHMVKKDGTIFWGHLDATVQDTLTAEVQAGTPELRIVLTDLTARKQAEQLLQESNERLREVLENALDASYKRNLLTNTYDYLSPVFAQISGYTPDEFRNLPIETVLDIIHPEDLANVEGIIAESISNTDGTPSQLEYRFKHKDGQYRWFRDRFTVTQNMQGHPAARIGSVSDITNRKQMEEELLRARKLESLGVLAGGIAHDFNNLMTVVQGYIELAIMELPANSPAQKMLLTSMSSVHKTQDLTSKLITFSRGGGPVKEGFDATAILRNAVNMKIADTKVRAKFDFKESLWEAEADEFQMKHCFYNLTTNAVEAMPGGGNLAIMVENALIPAGKVPELQEGSYLKITFSDEGSGIPKDILVNVFDPYFTTKKIGAQQGLGLGLAVCYSVMKKHGGHITVKSQPGKGTSFVLYLPARPDLAEALPGKKEIKTTSSTSKCRTLIMDDEPQIREIERVYLERMGHEVTDVKDGQEAIDAYKIAFDAGKPFDLVMLDLTVRHGMGGQEAMACLLTIDPKIKAIIASGFVDDPLIEYYADYGFKGALKKPFMYGDVKSIMEKILKPKGDKQG